MRTVLFICTGNTCRSPMAEAIARHAIDRGDVPGGTARSLFVASAGVHASEDAPVSAEVITTLRRRGIEHRGAAKRLTADMIRRADLVLGMTEGHLESARALVEGEPEQLAKIAPLDPAGDIEDPIGMGQAAYDGVAVHLADLMPRRLAELLSAAGRARPR